VKQTSRLNVLLNLRISGSCIGPPAGLHVVVRRIKPELACDRTPVLKTGASNCFDDAKNKNCICLRNVKQRAFDVSVFREMRLIFMLRHDVN
jgi:hypothetical protein